MKNIILFASGGGSNVKAILNYFSDRRDVAFPVIICNNPKAGVIQIAAEAGIDVHLVDRNVFQSEVLVDTLDFYKPDLLVLAGFLWKVPEAIVKAFPQKIINIHPALLPRFGGKGMYGHHVHEAVIAAGETESGITIHWVNEVYDAGTILLQKKIAIQAGDDAGDLAKRVLTLEHEWYPKVIDSLISAS